MVLIDQINIEVHVVMIDQLNDMVEFQAFVQQVLVILKQKMFVDFYKYKKQKQNLHNFVCFLIFNFLVSINNGANNQGKLNIRLA